ncbi:MAG: signal peptidase II [Alphaproteobacteria bacterium]|nr:signal peptidase II [Alphaproteobacteria bacterium]
MLGYGLVLAGVVLVLDQITKWIFYAWLIGLPFWGAAPRPLPRGMSIEVTGFFNLVTVWNYGVSFGMFNQGSSDSAWLLAALAGAITIALLLWLRRAPNLLVASGLGLVIGGAVGNVVDRLRLGAVFDFLDLHAFGWHWPAFNIADAGICVGVGLLLVDALFAPKPSGK